ncbi:hypothetical protein GCM10027277_00120 [Pseudoduganella ginsengisoli]|uniref:Transporter n=1 Tax=Pseudoduganella ginsengisoli TaxID=1462440 RepID=A0A6L6Q3P6_9BURK|nr:transporter [Pseudoduganella ginsengisoli]MTW03921.1 transporter [Pseudoduganella ginsengisoli]
MRSCRAAMLLMLSTPLLSPLTCLADEAPPVTPYRPSVSSPAQLPAPGQLELELGGLAVRDHGARRDSLPYAFKLGFNPEWGVVVSGEAYVSQRDAGMPRDSGIGDTAFTLKRAWAAGEGEAYGLEVMARAPTAKSAIGSGKADYGLNAICSRDFGSVHMDANLNATRIGARGVSEGRVQTGLSASFSAPVNDKWGATLEWSGTRRSGVASTAQLLAAAAYSPHPRLTLDVGVARGLNHATPQWALFTGMVLPIANF